MYLCVDYYMHTFVLAKTFYVLISICIHLKTYLAKFDLNALCIP